MTEPTPAPTEPRNFAEADRIINRTRENKLGGADFEYVSQIVKFGGDIAVTLSTPGGVNIITDTLPPPGPGKVHRIEVRVRVFESDADAVRLRGE